MTKWDYSVVDCASPSPQGIYVNLFSLNVSSKRQLVHSDASVSSKTKIEKEFEAIVAAHPKEAFEFGHPYENIWSVGHPAESGGFRRTAGFGQTTATGNRNSAESASQPPW